MQHMYKWCVIMTVRARGGIKMSKYENPKLEIVALQKEDIIRTSGRPSIDEGEVGI